MTTTGNQDLVAFKPPWLWSNDANGYTGASGEHHCRVPFDPSRWDEYFELLFKDINASALRFCKPHTDAARVPPGSMMYMGGRFYVRPEFPEWIQQGGSDIADLDTFATAAELTALKNQIEGDEDQDNAALALSITNLTAAMQVLPHYSNGPAPHTPAKLRDEWENPATGVVYRRVSDGPTNEIWRET